MSTAFMRLGYRAYDNSHGVFIAPPGVDALTASAAQLLLHITKKIPQIILNGVTSGALPQTVTLGVTTYVPMVFINQYTSTYPGQGGIAYWIRPRGNVWVFEDIRATLSAASMYVEEAIAGTSSRNVGYQVFNQDINA